MTQKNRLASGGRIDQQKPLKFTYGGTAYTGYQGDTVASALLANGVDIIGRSFKYSRPRGIMAAGSEEPNALLQLGATEATQTPNVRATQQDLFEGLVAGPTNGWPSPEKDAMGVIGKIGRLIIVEADQFFGATAGSKAGWGLNDSEIELSGLRQYAGANAATAAWTGQEGFDYGSGFEGITMRGSEHNDAFINENGTIKTTTNHSGGIQGGISNGMDIYFRAAFKPVATIVSAQDSLNEAGESVTVVGKGRHDPCVLPRAVPIVEAMTALTIADFLLRQRTAKLNLVKK